MKTIIINELELTTDQAWALAQFVKRLSWDGVRACAINDEEAYLIRDAIYQLQKALVEAGRDRERFTNTNRSLIDLPGFTT